MISYTLKRILAAIPTLLIIITLAFFLMHAAPGGPFAAERPVPPAVQQNLNRMYHLDQPLIAQYGDYLADILRGDFGPSFKYADYSVNDLIAAGFPVSLQLGVSAILLALILGIAAGAYAALRRDSWADHLLRVVTMTGISVPNFVVAPLLILIFAVTLHWLPAGGWNRGAFADAVLPTIALALPYIAYIARLTRTGMIEA
ncbi:MAG TPA: ABC transporter permease subunit, partial [Gammaproteobacteria bacterium]|nr:ABC transporter permease subunit [Gammaproteobacteria bacterium]